MEVCDNCPMRLFNVKHHNLKGIGNPFYGNLIVIPNVDYEAYKKGNIGYSAQVRIIKEIISSTGGEELVYFVPFIRCNETISCDVTDDIIRKCIIHLANDIEKYNFNNILILGDAAKKFFNSDEITGLLTSVMISRNNRRYCVNYSPLVKFKDDDKFKVFEDHLKQWIDSVKNNDFSYYLQLRL